MARIVHAPGIGTVLLLGKSGVFDGVFVRLFLSKGAVSVAVASVVVVHRGSCRT